jgi:hypothetical protein
VARVVVNHDVVQRNVLPTLVPREVPTTRARARRERSA